MKFKSYNCWIAIIIDFKSGDGEIIGDYNDFELRCSVVPQREIGTRCVTRKSRSLLLWWSISHKSCVNQGDNWVIKFRLDLNLFDLIKLWTS